jgi:ribosome maturation factor RimP
MQPGSGRPPITAIFERALHDIAHDSRFAGVEIVQSTARGGKRSVALSVTIDREGGVDVASCERVAALINSRLESYDEPYTLEVESAGLNRPLTKPGDYERFSGRDAKVVTSLLVQGGKTHRGILRGVRGTNVILETSKGELPLPLATIERANLEYDIRSDLKRDKKERKNSKPETAAPQRENVAGGPKVGGPGGFADGGRGARSADTPVKKERKHNNA